jgi:glycine betaine/proline transport system permease protein
MIDTFMQKKYLQFIALLVVFILLTQTIGPAENSLLWRLPPLLSAFPLWINDSISYLMFEWWPIDVYDPDIEEFEQKPLVSQMTRMVSGFILFMIELIRELMLGGAKTIVAFSGWDWATANPWAKLPGVPWTVIAGGAAILGYALGGRGLSLLAGLSMTYIAVFGQWEPAMQTLSFVLVAAPVSVFIGLMFGIWAFRSKTVENVLNPLLNMAQIIPHFSYLIPVMVFFGIGDHAGAIATVIFATPPMVRLTLLGLKKLGPEVAESGMMSGCNNWQLLTKVMVPTARRDILIGVNQVIMQCLAMVVLASLIGAKGLGIDLLIALNGLKIGVATEIGICIVLIAIMLDRLSLAWANQQTDYFSNLSLSRSTSTHLCLRHFSSLQ